MSLPLPYLEVIVVALGLVVLLAEAFFPLKKKAPLGWLSFCGLVVTLILLIFAKKEVSGPELERFYAVDNSAVFFKGFALVITALVILMGIDYRKVLTRFTENPQSEDGTGEFYSLPLFACAGLMWMASAKDLVMAFVALELTTITFYVLVAFMRRNVGSLEAGVKYLILGALSTGFLVYGIAWIYGITGTMNLETLNLVLSPTALLENGLAQNTTALLFGLSLILIALAFKVGAVPMHIWIPDVYQGAPTPTTTFLSVGSKAAGFIVAVRILEPFLSNEITRDKTIFILGILAAATLLVGNLAAIAQNNLKRLLAYSSIANAGFLLLAVAAWRGESANALSTYQVVGFYLATYLLMTVAALFALQSISQSTGSEQLKALHGLGKSQPGLAWALTIIFAALAGLPLTVGFFGKLYVFQAAVANGQLWWAIAMGFIGVAAGFYYYFKAIRAMFWNPATDGAEIRLSLLAKTVVFPAAALIIFLGVYPAPILALLGNS
ncbi:NADH-quinone oxidoreductase subunit N [Roseibacillus ishigakijimensis]|uniref:NADH-quinone oxidoreductase subunit N n=1 Tax=Roseibacillus ishigakijimensis TaxID=454146 RepID=A0A934VLK8_9BACT|nr:NADH-quinone oxidoreductase subunit N [Roseibacillus ishigakijimensis]MBK1833342.1 NADH-quinone oxidoreductase subunit N [Roseibacillus ishigakijimensis]